MSNKNCVAILQWNSVALVWDKSPPWVLWGWAGGMCGVNSQDGSSRSGVCSSDADLPWCFSDKTPEWKDGWMNVNATLMQHNYALMHLPKYIAILIKPIISLYLSLQNIGCFVTTFWHLYRQIADYRRAISTLYVDRRHVSFLNLFWHQYQKAAKTLTEETTHEIPLFLKRFTKYA